MKLFIYIKKNILLNFFFLLILIIGLSIFKDYGLYIDEDNSRENGFVTLKYLAQIFYPHGVTLINQVIEVQNIHEYYQQGNGVVFDAPMAFFEIFFNVTDSRTFYLFRHLFNFIFFFIALILFFKIVKNRYGSNLMGIFGVLLLFLSPRIFAESFYNTKDIFFMSLFIITLFAALNFLKNKNYINAVFFALASSLMVDTRILGIYFPFLISLIYIIDLLRNNNGKNILPFITFLIFLPIFIIIFWPFLWSDPLENFISVFKNLANLNVEVYNFYLGEYILAKNVPWHYLPVWICITTPIFYLFFFFIGFIFILRRMIKRLFKIDKNESYNDLWRGKKELQDLIFLFAFLTPLFVVIALNSPVYDGWRHLYFVYPSFIMIALFGINLLNSYLIKKNKNIKYIIFLILFLPTSFWIYKNHPNQNVFFNVLAGKHFDQKFEMDYWGNSNKAALEFISKNNDGIIKISNINTNDLNLSKKILNKNMRDKIDIVDNHKYAQFIINNYRDWKGRVLPKNFMIPDNYIIYHEIKVQDIVINTIYKNTNKILN